MRSVLGRFVKNKQMGLTIRPGRPSDASDVAAAHVAAWRVAYRGLVQDDFLDSPIFATSRRDGWHRMLGGELPNGWDPACLWVLRDNPRARRFYERQGWTAQDNTDVQYWEGPTIAGLAPLEPLAELRYVR